MTHPTILFSVIIRKPAEYSTRRPVLCCRWNGSFWFVRAKVFGCLKHLSVPTSVIDRMETFRIFLVNDIQRHVSSLRPVRDWSNGSFYRPFGPKHTQTWFVPCPFSLTVSRHVTVSLLSSSVTDPSSVPSSFTLSPHLHPSLYSSIFPHYSNGSYWDSFCQCLS